MPSIWLKKAEYDWVMDKRKEISIPGKPKSLESAAIVMKRIRENYKGEPV